MGMGPLAMVIFAGCTFAAVVFIFIELSAPVPKLLWLGALVAGIYLAPLGAHALAPIATVLLLGAKGALEKARGSTL